MVVRVALDGHHLAVLNPNVKSAAGAAIAANALDPIDLSAHLPGKS